MERGNYGRSHNVWELLGKNKWAAQENSGSRTTDIRPMVLGKQVGTNKQGPPPSADHSTVQHRSCFLHQPSVGAKFTTSRLHQWKHVYGGVVGWGPTHPSSNTVTLCPAPQRRGIIPILSKANAAIILTVTSSSPGTHLCIYPVAILKLFFGVVLFTDRFEIHLMGLDCLPRQ